MRCAEISSRSTIAYMACVIAIATIVLVWTLEYIATCHTCLVCQQTSSITLTVASYNFNVSSYNCKWKCFAAWWSPETHQVNFRKTLRSCQIPPIYNSDPQSYFIQHRRINFPKLWVNLWNLGNFAPRENNPLYGSYIHSTILLLAIVQHSVHLNRAGCLHS